MKLALAVGDKHHYAVDTIMPRHFVQSAGRAGIGSVGPIFEDLQTRGPAAAEAVLSALPADFPAQAAESIARGFAARLRRLDVTKS